MFKDTQLELTNKHIDFLNKRYELDDNKEVEFTILYYEKNRIIIYILPRVGSYSSIKINCEDYTIMLVNLFPTHLPFDVLGLLDMIREDLTIAKDLNNKEYNWNKMQSLAFDFDKDAKEKDPNFVRLELIQNQQAFRVVNASFALTIRATECDDADLFGCPLTMKEIETISRDMQTYRGLMSKHKIGGFT